MFLIYFLLILEANSVSKFILFYFLRIHSRRSILIEPGAASASHDALSPRPGPGGVHCCGRLSLVESSCLLLGRTFSSASGRARGSRGGALPFEAVIPSAPLRTCSSSSAGPWTPPRASSQDPGRKPGRYPKRGPRPRDPRLASANSHAGFSFSATTYLISHQFLLDFHQVVKLRFQSRPISLYPPPCSHGVLRTKEAQTESSSLSC